MGLGRRSFLRRTATVVGTIGAAGSAASWEGEAKARKELSSSASRLYDGYIRDLQQVVLEVEKQFRAFCEFDEWPEEPSTERNWTRHGDQPEWLAYDKACQSAKERQFEQAGVEDLFGLFAPMSEAGLADMVGILEQKEAKPIVIVAAPRDFADFRKMGDKVQLLYDEGPIRARAFDLPVVTSTAVSQGHVLVAGLKDNGDLRLVLTVITR